MTNKFSKNISQVGKTHTKKQHTYKQKIYNQKIKEIYKKYIKKNYINWTITQHPRHAPHSNRVRKQTEELLNFLIVIKFEQRKRNAWLVSIQRGMFLKYMKGF